MLSLPKVIKQTGGPIEDWLVPFTVAGESAKPGPGPEPETEPETEPVVTAEDLSQQAESVLANARLEAEKLLAEAKQSVLDLEREAYLQGYKKGEEDARRSSKKAQAEFHEATKKVLQDVERIRTQIYKDTEAELLELAVNIAEKLVCSQLALKPETIADIALEACAPVRDCEMMIVYVPPEQIESITARQAEIAAQLYKTKRLKIIADPLLTSGGCRIETEQGYVDATIATMLKKLNKILGDSAA